MNVGLAGYQMAQPVTLATYFNAARQRQTDEALGLKQQALAAQKAKLVATLAAQQRQNAARQGLAAAAYGAPNYSTPGDGVTDKMVMTGSPTPQEPPGGQATQSLEWGQAVQTALGAGVSMDEISGFAEFINKADDRQVEQMERMSGFIGDTASAALTMLDQGAPMDQVQKQYQQALAQFENDYGVDIPDEYQTANITPEALDFLRNRALGAKTLFDAAKPTASMRNAQYATGGDNAQARALVGESMKPAPAATIINKGETEFAKVTGKNLAEAQKAMMDSGQSAVGTEGTFRELGNLLAEGVNTGSVQPLVASLQGVAEDLGVDLSGTADALGIDLGNLGDRQNFDRLATQIVIDGFEKFRGNLNQKEVDLALGAFGGLGSSPEANADAIAAGIAASQIARERALEAADATTQREVRQIQKQILSGDVSEFRKRKAAIKRELLDRRKLRTGGEMPAVSSDEDYEALPSGTKFRAPDGSVRVKP